MRKIININRVKKIKRIGDKRKSMMDKFINREILSSDFEGVKFLNKQDEEEIEFLGLMQKIIERQDFIDKVNNRDCSPVISLVEENKTFQHGYKFRSLMVIFLLLLASGAVLFSNWNVSKERINYQTLNIIPASTQNGKAGENSFVNSLIPIFDKNSTDTSAFKKYPNHGRRMVSKNYLTNKEISKNIQIINPLLSEVSKANKKMITNVDNLDNEKSVTLHDRNGDGNKRSSKGTAEKQKNLLSFMVFNIRAKKLKMNGVEKKKAYLKSKHKEQNIVNLGVYHKSIEYKNALSYDKLKDFKNAEDAYLKLIKANPFNPQLYLEVSSFYERFGKFGKLEKTLTALLRVDPNNIYAYKKRAFVCTITRKLNRAENDYTKLIELEPENQSNYQRRAALHKQRKFYKKAERDYTAIINLDPEDQKLFRSRGLFYKTTNQSEKAALDMVKYYTYVGLSRTFAENQPKAKMK